jgi:hypothetical protein
MREARARHAASMCARERDVVCGPLMAGYGTEYSTPPLTLSYLHEPARRATQLGGCALLAHLGEG